MAMQTGAERAVPRSARERILEAATQLFRAEGLAGTRMEAIAAAAPVSKRTLYKHFPDKSELIDAFLQDRDRRVLVDQLGSDVDARARILGLFDVRVAGRPVASCPFVAASTEFPAPHLAAHVAAADHKRRFERRLQELCAAAGVDDPARVGTIVSLLWDGAATRAQVLDDLAPLAEARAFVEEMLAER
ncbi:TetR/AcrR family transcriptional regulator [Curtobacterium pusillum]|uniref:TetR/AcrR family transcriptional regulator n=1 Tax=Curtobacterium pusillum TaxID=69373 RepID=UPI00119EBBC6|nr:TetR/AcrR family transcriptional regulator [Curtobacterium pusillum]